MDRAIKIVRTIFPGAEAEYIAAFDAGDAQLAAAGITTPLRLAHLLAQCGAESGGLTLTRESLTYKTAPRLQQIFNNMKLSKPLMPGEVKMLLRQEKDLGERFYGISLPSDLYKKNGMNGGINPGNTRKAKGLGNDRPGDGFLFRGNGLLQTRMTELKATRSPTKRCRLSSRCRSGVATPPGVRSSLMWGSICR